MIKVKKVKKAVIVAAGLGTRFLPITKSFPKEMLPVVDKPVIQYIIEEIIDSGIKEIIIVISPDKKLIKDYFLANRKLELFLRARKKSDYLKEIIKIKKFPKIKFCYQNKPLGIADAILKAENWIKDQPFALFFADDLVAAKKPCLKQLIELYQKKPGAIVAVEAVPRKDIFRYGIIKGKKISSRAYQIVDLVEKPKLREAPSNLAIVGRYILVPPILKIIKKLYRKSLRFGEEIYLTDALKMMLELGHKNFYACQYQGRWLSCGNKAGWLEANLILAKDHPEIKKDFKNIINHVKKI